MRVRLLIAYQGTRYRGWQVQPREATVQAILQDAFFRLTGLRAGFTAAGRTDAGVHAAGQVVAVDNHSRHDPWRIREGLNALLPEDLAVLEAEEAPGSFDPCRDAVGKHYRYTIHNSRVRPIFARGFCWQVKKALDLEAMNRAAGMLAGEHDFSAFRGANCTAKNAVRRLDKLLWSAEPPALFLNVWGRGFLKQMVRNIAGTCVEVGRGRLEPETMAEILRSRDRRRAGPTAPACGLCLVRVYYQKEEYQLAFTEVEQGLGPCQTLGIDELAHRPPQQ